MDQEKTPREASDRPVPVCKAILLCEQVFVDHMTRKKILVGIIHRLRLGSFPGPAPAFTVFLQLTDGIGKYRITIEIRDLNGDAVIARGGGPEIEFRDRFSRLEILIPLSGLPLPHPGPYDFIVFADGNEIDRQRFLAQLPEEPNHGQAAT
jgi:hypothetical protein